MLDINLNKRIGSYSRGGYGIIPLHLKHKYILQMAITTQPPYGTVELCTPISGKPFDLSTEPPRTGCGNYQWDLQNFPLNQCTYTSGNTRTFGASEMVLCFVRFDNYPRSAGTATLRFYAPDGRLIFEFNYSLYVPDPSWTWWYTWLWGCIGKFIGSTCNAPAEGEIVVAGNYWIDIITPWGNGRVDYTIIDSCPNPSVTISI